MSSSFLGAPVGGKEPEDVAAKRKKHKQKSNCTITGTDTNGPTGASVEFFPPLDLKSSGGDFFDTPSPAISPCVTDEECHTITISDKAYSILCHLRRDAESDSEVMERGLLGLDAYRIAEKALKAHAIRKAYTAARHMRKKGFSDEATIATIRALFGSQSEKDLWNAFWLLDTDESGFIDKEELLYALPLMGEDISEDQLDNLFQSVDVDRSGLIDFEEFCTLVRGLNPQYHEDGVTNAFSQFRNSTEGGLDAVGEVLGSAASSASSTVSALSTAWSADLPGLSGMEMRKVGVVLNNMQQAGYSEKMARTICRALFCEQSDKLLRKAFDFYDSDKNGVLDAAEFRDAMPLMGEDVAPEQIDDLFSKVVVGETQHIRFEDFCKLVKGMNPPKKRPSDAFTMVSDAWGCVQRTWVAKTTGLQDENESNRRSSASNVSHSSKSNLSSRSSVPTVQRRGSECSKKSARKSASSSKAAGTDDARRTSNNVIVLPPRSQRVSVARQPVPASQGVG